MLILLKMNLILRLIIKMKMKLIFEMEVFLIGKEKLLKLKIL